jgi:hypothetical protein
MTGINIAPPTYFSGGLAANDMIKFSGSWRLFSDVKTEPSSSDLDANGYVIGDVGEDVTCFVSQLYWWDSTNNPTEFVLLYDGAVGNNLEFSGATTADITITDDTQAGKIYFTINSGGNIWLRIRDLDTLDPIARIRIVPEDLETQAIAETMPFLTDRWKEIWAGFGVLRHLDTLAVNDSTETDVADIKPAEGFGSSRLALTDIVKIHNETQTDMWLCIPHLATDAWVQEVATHLYTNLDSGIRVYLEYSNECWNTQFDQAHYLYGEAGDDWTLQRGEYANTAIAKMDVFRTYFPDHGRLTRVFGAQYANPIFLTGAHSQVPDLYDHFEAIAVGYYVGYGWTKDNYSGNTVDDVIDSLEAELEANALTFLQAYQAICEEHGVDLVAYEAGQHASGGTDTDAKAFYRTVQASPRMHDLYSRMQEIWEQVNGKLICWYSTSYHNFGTLWQQNDDLATSYKYQALQDNLYNQQVETPNREGI